MKTRILVAVLTLVLTNIISSAKINSSQPDTYAYTRGVEAYNEEKYQDALDWFNKELSDHPVNGYAYVYISVLRYGNQEYGKALSAIDNALKRLPKKDKNGVPWLLLLEQKFMLP